MTHDENHSDSAAWWPIVLLVAVALLLGMDLVVDSGAGTSAGHLALEAVTVAVALFGAAGLWRQARAAPRPSWSVPRPLSRATWRAHAPMPSAGGPTHRRCCGGSAMRSIASASAGA